MTGKNKTLKLKSNVVYTRKECAITGKVKCGKKNLKSKSIENTMYNNLSSISVLPQEKWKWKKVRYMIQI